MEPYAIASPEPQATAAGRRVLEAGGNAIDAALATAAALTVTFPHNCALGGDAFILVHDPGGETLCINASGPAARAADADALLARHGRMPLQGPDTITVPGVVAGWERLHAAGAALPWRVMFEDAIRYAADGMEVSASLAGAIEDDAEGIAADPGLRAVFLPQGRVPRDGETLRQPALAASLRALASGGARVLYDGALGDRLLAGLERLGCALADVDLHGFVAEACAPLGAPFGDHEILTSPPNSQGVVLLQALAALHRAGAADPLGADAGLFAELLRLGSLQRDATLADGPWALGDWLGEAAIGGRLEEARGTAATAPAAVAAHPRPTGDTVAIVTADAEGRAVSLIQSVFWSFGALMLEPDTGIVMHNRGALFTLQPGHPNRIAPGKRPAHTLMPVMAQRHGRLRFVLGCMGGRAQPQILGQVLLRLLRGDDPQAAVSAARFVAGPMESDDPPDVLRIEDGMDETATASLGAAGLAVRRVPALADDFGHAQAIALDADGGAPVAGSDPRSATPW